MNPPSKLKPKGKKVDETNGENMSFPKTVLFIERELLLLGGHKSQRSQNVLPRSCLSAC